MFAKCLALAMALTSVTAFAPVKSGSRYRHHHPRPPEHLSSFTRVGSVAPGRQQRQCRPAFCFRSGSGSGALSLCVFWEHWQPRGGPRTSGSGWMLVDGVADVMPRAGGDAAETDAEPRVATSFVQNDIVRYGGMASVFNAMPCRWPRWGAPDSIGAVALRDSDAPTRLETRRAARACYLRLSDHRALPPPPTPHPPPRPRPRPAPPAPHAHTPHPHAPRTLASRPPQGGVAHRPHDGGDVAVGSVHAHAEVCEGQGRCGHGR